MSARTTGWRWRIRRVALNPGCGYHWEVQGSDGEWWASVSTWQDAIDYVNDPEHLEAS